MKRKLVVLLVLVVVLSLASIPAFAGPPGLAGGTWVYEIKDMAVVRQADCNTFMTTYDEGVMTGTFEGTETEYGEVVIHCDGRMSFKGDLSFVGTVVDESGTPRQGTLEMRILGSFVDPAVGWEGTWTILSGTGGLENLRGHGTDVGWGMPDAPTVYAGKYHFDPD